MKTTLYVVYGADPNQRLAVVQALLSACAPLTRTLLASAEVLSWLSVEAQAEVLRQDMLLKAQGVHVLRLSPGCLCCSSKLVLSTHIGRTLRLNQPEVLVLELDSQSHSQSVKAFLEEPQWTPWFSCIHMREVSQKDETGLEF